MPMNNGGGCNIWSIVTSSAIWLHISWLGSDLYNVPGITGLGTTITIKPLEALSILSIVVFYRGSCCWNYPDSKVHGANMRPIWGWQDPGGPHVDPMNFTIWVPSQSPLADWSLGDMAVILKALFSNSIYRLIVLALALKSISGECHRTSLIRNQHWFR